MTRAPLDAEVTSRKAVRREVILAVLLCNVGCMVDFTTEVRLRDPARASLRTSPDPATTLLPEGRVPARATVAKGWLPSASGPRTLGATVEPGLRLPYDIGAVREADGSIAFDDGYRHDIVSSDGKVRVLKTEANPPIALHQPEALIPMCAHAWVSSTYRVGRRYGACSPGDMFPGVLATPWDNVAEIRKIGRQERKDASWLLIVLGGLLSVPGASLVIAGADGGSPRVPLLVSGSVLLGASAAVFAALAPTLFGRDRIEILFPPPTAR